MKRAIKSAFILALCLATLFSVNAQAYETEKITEQSIFLTQSEINEILAQGNHYTAPDRATGLILVGSAAINDDYSLLQYVATIDCDIDVVKCGFEDIIVQQRKNSSYSWTKYYQFDDDMRDYSAHTCVKAVTVAPGYEYRVKATLYAKKNIFSVQRETIYSNIKAW